MKIPSRLFFCALILFCVACSNDSEEDLFGVQECDETEVSYSARIAPILEGNCAFSGCHSANFPAVGINLSSFTTVSDYLAIDQARFLGSINHESGFSPMPRSADKLSSCDIYYIETWIAEGANNN